MELVSVVIPCFNSGATLGQTVASLKAQTWPKLEIVVVDDGSNDPHTLQVLAGLEGVHLVRQANAGLPAARNAGCTAATGEFILLLDADDWLEPDAVAVLRQTLSDNPQAAYAFCNVQLEGEASGVLKKHYNFFEQLFLNQLPYCLFMPKKLWASVGGYDANMRQGYEDWEFNIRLGEHGHHPVQVVKPLFHYRVASSGMLISKSNRLHGQIWSAIIQRHPALYRAGSLFRLWREWRKQPSQYPLAFYFIWRTLHMVLPDAAFAQMFKTLRSRSSSRRLQDSKVVTGG